MNEETEDKRLYSEDDLSKQLYRLRKLNEELATINARRQRELDETAAWYESEAKSINANIEEANALIDDYARRRIEEDSWWKYAGRNGKVSKKKETKWGYDKKKILEAGVDDKFIKIKTTRELDWAEYKKTLTEIDDGRLVNENGEVVASAKVTHGLKITIKPTEG